MSAGGTERPEPWNWRLRELAGDLADHASDERTAAARAILETTRELCELCGDLLGTPVAPPARKAASAPTAVTAPASNRTSLTAHLLGPLRISLDDQPVENWNGHKSRCVIGYLLAHSRKKIPKDILLELLWCDADPDAGRRNLHQAVYSARQVLRRQRPDVDCIRFEDGCYGISPELAVWVDAEEFERRVAAGRRLDAQGQRDEAAVQYGIAEAIYRGDFLEDCLYDDWTRPRRDELRSIYRHTAGRLCEHYARRGEHSAAIAICQKVLTLDACDENAHRNVMRLYAAQGQRHLALQQFQTCARALRDNLGLAPSEETRAVCRELAARPQHPSTIGHPMDERRLSPR